MKNVQVIDGADNAVYDIFEIGDGDFAELFPQGQDVTFIEDLEERVPKARLSAICEAMWAHRVRKNDAMGIHGVMKRRSTPTAPGSGNSGAQRRAPLVRSLPLPAQFRVQRPALAL
jgi:hypothetical protein